MRTESADWGFPAVSVSSLGPCLLSSMSFLSRLAFLQTRNQFRHRVMYELRAQFSQHILFGIFKRRFHSCRRSRAPGRSRPFHESAPVVRFSWLPDDSADRQVAN